MATTENIGLTLFEGQDYVSREAINANFQKISEALGIDYVKERGKSGDWEWVKYNSGFMEQWISRKAFESQEFGTYGSEGLKCTPLLSFGNYPIAFTAPPLFFISFVDAGDNGGITFGSWVMNEEEGTVNRPPRFRLIDAKNAVTTINTPYFGIYARGYYK